ncbi:phage head-tail adaptor family protein, putative (macronuclear) [Tetrahymena thermophila SB210]|uniref:Phage head-tail adaptor family protein, putative n=1 Tax=Tetrahymena thermophila (strain SB210) TaxID=312017 RepID=W7XKE3_TETTS|nr:phage head-tail adaptor family protein, putative [Tetrahymena thermophila SB210]EWS74829.1 phage head-tail adaptor family protein, putative [Tetrahymena thermophila SB210]|eukprot:XP_012652542.1 phage head-tail adaptor family protein, putative [Tetrahymena thermophila SB210]
MKQNQQGKEQFTQELAIQKSNSQYNKDFQDGKLDKASQGTNQITEQNKLLSHQSEQNKDSISLRGDNTNNLINLSQHEKQLDKSVIQHIYVQDEEIKASRNQLINQRKVVQRKIETFDRLAYYKKKMIKKSRKLQKSLYSVLFKRKLFRIILLLAIEAVVLALIIAFFNILGYNRGQIQIYASDQVEIQVNKCVIKIIDYDNKDKIDLNYLSRASLPSTIDGDILMVYSFPDIQPYKKDYSFSQQNSKKTFSFSNNANYKSCEIAFYVYQNIQLTNLSINCQEQQCDILIDSSNISFTSLSIQGPQVYLNSPKLIAQSLQFLTFQGNFEVNNFQFSNASVETSEGDIIVQSLQGITATVQLTNKYYCVSTYSLTPIQNTITSNPASCTNVFPYGTTDYDPKNVIAERCIQGSITIPSNIGGNQNLIAKNTFGNLFINVLEKIGQAADQIPNGQYVYDSSVYGKNGDQIQFSTNSQSRLNDQMVSASNPNVYDPIFIMRFGSSQIESNTYSQWQLTYNPAYSYFRPFWLGTLTLSLLNSQRYENQFVLAPGFCPYVNSLSQNRLNTVKQLLQQQFKSQQNSAYFIFSLAWQPSISLPPIKFTQSDTYSSLRDTSLSDNYVDDWIQFNKNNDGTVSINYLSISQSGKNFVYVYIYMNGIIIIKGVLEAAIIVSFILASIVGLVLIVGIVYVINVNYIYLLDHISNIDIYSKIIDSQQNQNEKGINSDEELEDQKEEELAHQQVLEQVKQKDVLKIEYTIKGILKLFFNLILLSPPLSAYIDQVVILFYKARQNSISEFYKLLFKEVQINEKASDDIIHNLEKDSIVGSELKGLYEKYCYLNQVLERKLDEEESIIQLRKRGFKIMNKYDALIQSYSYIKYNGKIVTISDTQNKDSLQLFIESSCTLTKFPNDTIDSISFEQFYSDFCIMNHIPKQSISEGQLQRDYGVETKYDPLQVIERDPSYNLLNKKKMFIIDKKRVNNTFKLLLSKNLQGKQYQTDEMEEVKKELFSPDFWWFYDAVTVLAHLGSVVILGCPFIVLIIFIRMLQSNYSSVPIQRLIYSYDILEEPSSIPYKLMSDSNGIAIIVIISIIFLVLSSFDLVHYYIFMTIPQERQFQDYNKSSQVRKLASKIMWVLALLVLYGIGVYLSLIGTWLILSAIINPNAFLPYATSAATFLTLVARKYQMLKRILDQGVKLLTDYLKGLAEKQFKDMLKKLDIGGKVDQLVPTDQIKRLCQEASSYGLIDQKLAENIQDNIEMMVRDPEAVAHLGNEVLKIAQDPKQYALSIMEKLEEKAKLQLEQQLKQYLPIMAQSLTQLLFSILSNQKARLKTELGTVLSDLNLEIQNKFQKNVDKKIMNQLELLQGPILKLLFECLSSDNQNRKQKVNAILQQVSYYISSLVLQKYPYSEEQYNAFKQAERALDIDVNIQKKKGGYDFKQLLQSKLKELDNNVVTINEQMVQKAIKTIFEGMYNIFNEGLKNNVEGMLKEFIKILQKFQSMPVYGNIEELSKFANLLNLVIEAFTNFKSLSRSEILSVLKKFIQDSKIEDKFNICQFSIIDFCDFLLLIIGSFNQEQKTPHVNQIREIFTSIFKDTKFANQTDIKRMSSIVAFFILGFRSNLQNIPVDVIKDLFEWLREKLKDNESEYKLNEFIKLILDNTGNNKGNTSQKNLILIQNLLSLFEKIYNNKIGQIENMQVNSQRIYGVSKEFSKFFLSILFFKNKNSINQSDWDKIIQQKHFSIICQKMRMSPEDLSGLIQFILNQKTMPQYSSFIRMIQNQYKIDKKAIKKLNQIINFVLSTDDYDIYEVFSELDMEKNIEFKISQSNKETLKKMHFEDFKLILQFHRGKYEFDQFESQITQVLEFNFTDFKEYITNNAVGKNKSTCILNFIKQIKFTNQALSYMMNNIQLGQITHQQIVQLIKLLKIGEDQGVDSKVANLFGRLVSLKNLNIANITSSSTIFKEQVQNVASIINLDERIVQTFLQLIFCPDDKLYESLNDCFQMQISGINYNQFINHCVHNLKEINDYQNQLAKINEIIFKNKIPLDLLKSIVVDMQIPQTIETVQFFLQLTNQKIPKSINSFVKFVFNSQQQSEKQEFIKLIQQNENNFLGVQGLVDIFTSTKNSVKLQVLLQYFADSENDYFLLIACMFCYLEGKSDGILLRIFDGQNNQNQILKLTIEQYLSRKLDIKIEFFQAFQAIFCSNTQQFSSAFIKFFRQVDYQEQRLIKEVTQKRIKANQIGPNEQSDTKTKIYLEIIKSKTKTTFQQNQNQQENFINNVTVSDKEVEQYINLSRGLPINTSFFSRELNIPLDVVEFFQYIYSIKSASDYQSINKVFEEMKNSSSVIQVLRSINLDLKDLKNCIKLLYQMIEVQEAQQLQESLNLPSTVNIEALQNLLLLDQDFDDSTNLETNKKMLTNSLNQNAIHKSFEIKTYWSSLIFCLTKNFVLLEAFVNKNNLLKLALSGNPQLLSIFQGFIGVIQKRQCELPIDKIYQDIYQLYQREIKKKQKEENNQDYLDYFGEDDDDDEELNDNKYQQSEEKNKSVIEIEKSNKFEYALYLLYKELQLSPVWILLMSGDVFAWDYYILRYYYTYKYYKAYQINPVISLILILQLRQTATIVKEFISYLEYYIQINKKYSEKGESQEYQQIGNKILEFQGEYLYNLIIKNASKATELAQACQFPQIILNSIAEEEFNTITDEKEKKNYSKNDINKLFERAAQKYIEEIEKNKQSYYDFIHGLYFGVDKICFRQPKNVLKKKKNLNLSQSLESNGVVHLLLISTLTQLQDSSKFIFSYNDKGQDHLIQVSYEIDFLLTTFDIFFFMKLQNPNFQKFYMHPIIGLCCGFNLDGNEILSHSPIPPIANPEFRSMLIFQRNLEDLNNYKMNYIESIFQDFGQIVQEIAKEDPLLILQKPSQQKIKRFSSNFFSVLNFTVRTDKSKQYMDRLIDEFDSFIESQYMISPNKKFFKLNSLKIEEQNESISISSDALAKEENSYLEFVQSPNASTLLGFFKQDYECLYTNNFMIQNYQEDLKLFVNILQLSGSLWSSFNKKIDQETFSRQIAQVTQFMNSNKKSILQITSLFFDTTEYDLSTISESMNISPKLLKNFAKVFLDKYNFDVKDFEQLLSQTNYSETNKTVIRNIISINNGWLDTMMELTKFSPLFQYSQGYQIFYQLLYSFDHLSIQSQKTEPNKINIANLILLSPDSQENRLMLQKIVFRLCKEVIKEQVKKAKSKNDQLFVQKYSHLLEEEKNKEKNEFMIQAMNNIIDNSWKFLFEKKEELINQFMSYAFNLSENQVKLFKVLTIFKPNLHKLQQKEINSIIQDPSIKKGFETLQQFGLIQKDIRKQYFDLILGITSQRGLLALNSLISLQDADKVFGQNSSKIFNEEGEQDQIKNKYQNIHSSLILKSLYLWKKISATNCTHQKLKDEEILQQIANTLTFLTAHIVDILESKANVQNNNTISVSMDKGDYNYKNLIKQFNSYLENASYDISFIDDLEVVKTSDKTSIANVVQSYCYFADQLSSTDISSYLTTFFIADIYTVIGKKHPIPEFMMQILEFFIQGQNAHGFENYFLSTDQNSFFYQLFQKDGQFDETSKNFSKFFYYFTKIILTYQLQISKEEKNKQLNQDFLNFLETCFNIVTNTGVPQFLKDAFNILQSGETKNSEKILKDLIYFLVKKSQLKEYLNINKDDNQISQKFYLIFKLLLTIFNSPTITLQDQTIVQSLTQLILIAGEQFVSQELVKSMIGLIQGDISNIFTLIGQFNLLNQNDLKTVQEFVSMTQKLAVFQSRSSLEQIKITPQKVLDDQTKDILKRLNEGKINVQDIFRALVSQEGQNGMINIDTFCTFINRIGIYLSQHRANEIFAIIKKTGTLSSQKQQFLLSEEEFERAFEYVNTKKISMSLEKLGISAALLALSLGTLILILVLLFVFIFLGIQAFTLGGTFGAIINSIIPMAAATGAASSQEDKSSNLNEKNIQNVIKETEQILNSKQL